MNYNIASCTKQIGNFAEYARLQSVINDAVYFSLLKKMNSAIIISKSSEKGIQYEL
jgi:hypothetical protein